LDNEGGKEEEDFNKLFYDDEHESPEEVGDSKNLIEMGSGKNEKKMT
jgi:hypothetical protein